MEATSKMRLSWSSYVTIRAVWLGSILLILSMELWRMNQEQHLAASQSLLRAELPGLHEAETQAVTTNAPEDENEDDIPSAVYLEYSAKYNETCAKLHTHHLEDLFVKPDLCFSRRRVQEILIDLVLTTSAVFTEHGITHFLDSGTLLGSYRHKSVIPHDVDSDMGIDTAGYETIKRTPIQFPPEYYFQAFDTDIHPKGTRYIELPVRVIHRESALYLDVFVYIDSVDDEGNEWTGPLASNAFYYCHKCPEREDGDRELKMPRDWVYPLQDCRFAKHTLKCPAKTEKYLDHMFGENYMEPDDFY